ncbi:MULTISPECIES: flagellar biosynthesis protein FlhF [Peribacillus]|uniref:flagellar biosynthesis protein FlhF n=1 Tax=Peribacillus TaxID=2675229 RepID=UPI001070B977|nr:flagellar biosynthesis protein FlhF [Peribacillus frigoritolerans]MEC0296550.1 flagellar biosynthesis protein FlhF [Peribacillus castrilensis]MEC0345605.1 flagellar biosynthesis protein FlhF [Peribacillus castrilensis]TFH60480.1 flagellar biosynthesis protein FlhF [Peribacillus frigoritolerans]
MKVKKYLAPTMNEAMKRIREELGSDAVILSSKAVYTGGFIGLFKKRNIEVIAAMDPLSQSIQTVTKQKSKKLPSKLGMASPALEANEGNRESADLLKEIEGLKDLIKSLQVYSPDRKYPGKLQKMHEYLTEQEVDRSLRSKIMDELLEKWFVFKQQSTDEEVQVWLEEAMFGILDKVDNGKTGLQKKYINFVGPTGVGKTTTLAKVAAETMLKHDKKVAFITTDTYRIAAIDQLKTYAKILNVPIEVAYNLEDFKRAAERFSHYDFVFIDTAGRNFRNAQYVKDLNEIIHFTDEMETYLVLSLTSKQKDMEDIYRQFAAIPLKQVIFTKADETSTFGPVFNFIHTHKLGAAYITDGQNVPDDIEIATSSQLMKMAFGAKKYERSS